MTFKELFQAGQCSIAVIDNWVQLWHEGCGARKPLQEFLGLSTDEYQTWLTHGNAGLAALLNAGHSPEYSSVYLVWDELTDQLQAIVNDLLGPGYTVSLRRQDYYYWDLRIDTSQEMTEKLCETICERLDLCGGLDMDALRDDPWIDSGYLTGLLSKLTRREVTSSHADDNGVYIICKSLQWSSPEFAALLIDGCEKRLRREIRSRQYPTVNQDTACHQLFGFMEALKVLGLLDAEQWRVDQDHFNDCEGPADPQFASAEPEDKEGICPACGGEIKYGQFELVDEGATYDWTCPTCGATGKEGYDLIFDGHHYEVTDGNGNKLPGRD